MPIFKSLVWLDPAKKSRRKRDSNPGPSALEEDVLTTRPTRRLKQTASSADPRATEQPSSGSLCSPPWHEERVRKGVPKIACFNPPWLVYRGGRGSHSCGRKTKGKLFVCWLVGCLTSQQHASVSQGRTCSDNFTCCHTEIEVADPTFYLTQSQYTDTGPTSPSADPITPGAWQGSHWSANFEVTGMTRPRKKSRRKRDSNPGSSALEADALPLGQRSGQKEKHLVTALTIATWNSLVRCWNHRSVWYDFSKFGTHAVFFYVLFPLRGWHTWSHVVFMLTCILLKRY